MRFRFNPPKLFEIGDSLAYGFLIAIWIYAPVVPLASSRALAPLGNHAWTRGLFAASCVALAIGLIFYGIFCARRLKAWLSCLQISDLRMKMATSCVVLVGGLAVLTGQGLIAPLVKLGDIGSMSLALYEGVWLSMLALLVQIFARNAVDMNPAQA